MKVFWLFNHPAPYKINYFNELGKQVDLDVYFERASEKSRNSIFYSEKPLSFSCHICASKAWGEGDNYTRDPVKALKKNRYDIIVINGWRTLTEQRTIAYCKRHKIPYVFWINGGIVKPNEGIFKRLIKTHFIKGAKLYFSPDENSASYLTYYGADKDKIAYYPYSTVFEKELPNGPIDLKEKKTLRETLGLKGERIYFSVGQFIERKNYKTLIRLWRLMNPSDSLYILGEGEQKEEYESLIRSLDLHNVFLLPFKPHEEILKYFKAGDCFVFLSKEDIYGHVINEALSQALPVVSSKNVNAALHLIKNGENGYLINLDNENENASLLRGFPNKTMEENALKVARDNTMEKSAQFFVDYFSKAK